ncbi:hypothetical protein [Thermotoga caldifontis]|uniref:hypothetical protein n=1 Tax=Thermotoga caldifontis TaxID=1508419 RepID=UPI0006946B1F|nr:hypothetical protein [Thermotoga caldifontis]
MRDAYEKRELTVQTERKRYKVFGLKHERLGHTIPLQQYGVMYSLDFARNRVTIQKLGKFRAGPATDTCRGRDSERRACT